ncbi:MAG: hypothetical protein M1826_006298 [Phylliscum demangeonii]|nr:MAG: hypothetical protein M1826_006298 [Phylliscum demangeonii]
MSRGNNDEQFKFLISCIRHANNSKVDFAAVAKECGIVSKGAAAKRYERMMKAHGIPTNITPTRSTPVPSPVRRESQLNAMKKRRKLEKFSNGTERDLVDDDEGVTGMKDEFGSESADQLCVKSEGEGELDLHPDTMSSFLKTSEFGYEISDGGVGQLAPGPDFSGHGLISLDDEPRHFFHLGGTEAAFAGGALVEHSGTGLAASDSIVIAD